MLERTLLITARFDMGSRLSRNELIPLCNRHNIYKISKIGLLIKRFKRNVLMFMLQAQVHHPSALFRVVYEKTFNTIIIKIFSCYVAPYLRSM